MTKILAIILIVIIGCRPSERFPRFLIDGLPDNAHLLEQEARYSGRNFIAFMEAECSLQSFERYLERLKIPIKLRSENTILPWDNIATNRIDQKSFRETGYSLLYFSEKERRKVLAAWSDGVGILQYETY